MTALTNLPSLLAPAGGRSMRQVLSALERVNVEVRAARAENRRLRRLAGDKRAAGILLRAEADAKTMLVWRFAGVPVSRSSCYELGMSLRRWEWARALLIVARVHDGRDVTAAEFAVAVAALERAAKTLADGDDLSRLIARKARRDRQRGTRRTR